MAAEYVLLYDGECRVCTALARGVKSLDMRRRIQTRSLQEAQGLLPTGLGPRFLESMHVVTPEGRLATGPAAIPAMLAGLAGAPYLEFLLNRSRGVRRVTQRLYDALGEVRGHLTCRPVVPSSEAHSLR
ncbi:MAG TPA: DCC1-like thiol-disulfide oxidoreductase family protein [Thermoplasmata archaeon]